MILKSENAAWTWGSFAVGSGQQDPSFKMVKMKHCVAKKVYHVYLKHTSHASLANTYQEM